MTIGALIPLGVIPALLIVLAGLLVLHVKPHHTANRRLLVFWLVTAALLAAATFISERSKDWSVNRFSILLLPVLIGALALFLLHLKKRVRLSRGAKAVVILLGWGLFLASTWRESYGLEGTVLSGALLLTALWVLVDRFDARGIVLSLACLAFIALFNVLWNSRLFDMPYQEMSSWSKIPPVLFMLLLSAMPDLTVALSAVLISASLQFFPRTDSAARPGAAFARWLPVVWRLGLAALLLGTLAYTIVWASIWDQTSDGLGGIWFAMQTSVIAVAVGMLMGFLLTGWRKAAGLAFAVLVPLLMAGAFNYGWDVSYHTMTEARAARIEHALKQFYSREGRYPEELRDLSPRDLLWIPRPVIVQGYNWCYQGNEDGYRLGAFYREFWSLPFSLRIYASAGSPPEAAWACEEELAELKARRDPPPLNEHAPPPTQEPLPTSVVPISKTPVQPLIRGRAIAMRNWSVDGQYLVFGLLDTAEEPPSMTLSFLSASSGEVCQAEGYPAVSSLRNQTAWLPDGRLLFVSEEGEMHLLRPCEAGAERLTDRYPVIFSQVAAYEGPSGRILLKSEKSYWLLDGNSLQARQIPEVSPNPYDLHWDNYAWSPGGEQVAISRLNGRDSKAGSTLYIVIGETAEVAQSLPLEYASDQSAPWVEWLTKDELLLHGPGVLAVIDLHSDSPRIVHVLQDIFALDIVFPDEISSMAWVVHPDEGSYHLAVRVNHPKNQDLYLYHSETDSVEVLRHEVNTLLFFPDGEWEELPRREDTPTYRDEYELVWVDTPRDSRRLVVQGHTPRNYSTLFVRYLSQSSQMVFSSSQGVSLVSVSDGELLYFWELIDAQVSFSYTYLAPNEEALVVIAEGVGLYFIPLHPATCLSPILRYN